MCTVGFFPTVYPDEDFRSVVYRYHVRTGYLTFTATILELFEVNSNRNPHMPRNLNAFFDNLPSGQGMSPNEILNNNTLWPLIRPFLSYEQIEQSMHAIQYGIKESGNFASRQISSGHRILSSKIRYCPQCLVDDFDRYGECFVHRSHQIDPIDVCPLHQINLVSHCPMCNVELSNCHGTRLLVTPQCSAGHDISNYIQKSSETSLAKLELYRDVQSIMESSKLDRQEVFHRFQIALASEGYLFLSGGINKNKLMRNVTNSLSDTTTEMGKLVEYHVAIQGISKLLHGDWNLLSLPFYAFLMRFLSGSVEEFLHGHMSIHSRPWSIADGMKRLGDLDSMESCSMKTDETELALKELAFSSEEAAATTELSNDRLARWRETILELISSENSLSRLEINKIAPGAYAWLKKNDRRWLEQILPKPKTDGTPLDWNFIDQELVVRVKAVVQKIYDDNPQRRIVRYAIINACSDTDRNRLLRGPTKVPQAWELLLKSEESNDDHLIRRTPALIGSLLRAGYTNVTLNSIMSRRSNYRGCSQRVRSEIIMILLNMGFHDVEHCMDKYL